MTAFLRADFDFHGGYLTYRGEFVARFKYSTRDRAGFQSFLIKNFSVEEYFAQRAAGVAPATILESRGYVSATIKKVLRSVGYPETKAGFDAYIAKRVGDRVAA